MAIPMHVTIASRDHRAPGRPGSSSGLQAEDQNSKGKGTNQNQTQHVRCFQLWHVAKLEPGTPEPSKISKAESHGCVRLTNWDALQLASAVSKGTPVEFIGEQKSPSASKHRHKRTGR
jgi:hypothetical protein